MVIRTISVDLRPLLTIGNLFKLRARLFVGKINKNNENRAEE